MKEKRGQVAVTPIEVIVGVLLIIAGLLIIIGKLNLGSLLATIGLLMEIVKEIVRKGL